MLAPVVEKVRTAVSRPVRLVSGNGFTLVSTTAHRAPPRSAGGRDEPCGSAGPRADAYFATLAKRINTKAQDAEFIVATAAG